MEKQIAQIMNTWVEDWNEKRMDDLTNLYSAHAAMLPSDGSRASGQGEIRAFLEKQIARRWKCTVLVLFALRSHWLWLLQ